jgi:transposase
MRACYQHPWFSTLMAREGDGMAGDQYSGETSFVAIDIGKAFHAVLVELPNGAHQRFRMANSAEDYARLVTFLRTLPGTVRVALEPTGNFHRTLAFHLITAGIAVVSVSSVAGARYREAMFNSRDKNDPKDATVILQLLKRGLVQHYHEPLLAGHHDLQELAKTYRQVALARKRLADSLLNHYLPLYFPEMARYWESTRVEWFVAFLSRFPRPQAVRALSLPEFIEAAWPLIGRKANKRAKLEELYELAQSSIALPVAVDSPAIDSFRLQLANFARLAELRRQLEGQAHGLLKDRRDYQCLCSLPGVTSILAMVILAEGGNLRRFRHHRQFLKYCGLDLAKCQSGQFRGREMLSKRGNALLRMAFWMAAPATSGCASRHACMCSSDRKKLSVVQCEIEARRSPSPCLPTQTITPSPSSPAPAWSTPSSNASPQWWQRDRMRTRCPSIGAMPKASIAQHA